MLVVDQNKLYAASDVVSGQCGIGTIKHIVTGTRVEVRKGWTVDEYFLNVKMKSRVYPLEKVITESHGGGAKFVGTGFINNDICRETYEIMCTTARLVFQTPVRKNTNSDNMFFYALFDNLDDKTEDGYLPTIQPKWPF